ncbi:MAG TPA: hypothetical protein V6C58_24405 [Allocoleopsis sp.]
MTILINLKNEISEFLKYHQMVYDDIESQRSSLESIYRTFYSEMRDLVMNGKKKIPKRRLDEMYQPTDGIEVLIGYDNLHTLNYYTNEEILSLKIFINYDFDVPDDLPEISFVGYNSIINLNWNSEFVINDSLNLNELLDDEKKKRIECYKRIRNIVTFVLADRLCYDVVRNILEFY